MFIDTLFVALLILAIFKGYSRGLVLAVLSSLAIFAGIFIALKVSAVEANYLKLHNYTSFKWMPLFTFILVLCVVILVVQYFAKRIDKKIDLSSLEWINNIGGIILYACVYITLLSVFLFYPIKMGIIGEGSIKASKTYDYIEVIGPKMVNISSKFFPTFKNLFAQLDQFFVVANKKAA